MPAVAVLFLDLFWGAAGAALSRVVTIVASCMILRYHGLEALWRAHE